MGGGYSALPNMYSGPHSPHSAQPEDSGSLDVSYEPASVITATGNSSSFTTPGSAASLPPAAWVSPPPHVGSPTGPWTVAGENTPPQYGAMTGGTPVPSGPLLLSAPPLLPSGLPLRPLKALNGNPRTPGRRPGSPRLVRQDTPAVGQPGRPRLRVTFSGLDRGEPHHTPPTMDSQATTVSGVASAGATVSTSAESSGAVSASAAPDAQEVQSAPPSNLVAALERELNRPLSPVPEEQPQLLVDSDIPSYETSRASSPASSGDQAVPVYHPIPVHPQSPTQVSVPPSPDYNLSPYWHLSPSPAPPSMWAPCPPHWSPSDWNAHPWEELYPGYPNP
ncbi:hypothetical protein CYMTET_13559, partial [Cymbomonas tetramitiformis]